MLSAEDNINIAPAICTRLTSVIISQVASLCSRFFNLGSTSNISVSRPHLTERRKCTFLGPQHISIAILRRNMFSNCETV